MVYSLWHNSITVRPIRDGWEGNAIISLHSELQLLVLDSSDTDYQARMKCTKGP